MLYVFIRNTFTCMWLSLNPISVWNTWMESTRKSLIPILKIIPLNLIISYNHLWVCIKNPMHYEYHLFPVVGLIWHCFSQNQLTSIHFLVILLGYIQWTVLYESKSYILLVRLTNRERFLQQIANLLRWKPSRLLKLL